MPEAFSSAFWLYRAAWAGSGVFLSALPGHAAAVAGALLVLGASWLAGLGALDWLAPAVSRRPGIVRHLEAVGLGLGALALLVFASGLLGIMYPAVLTAGLGAVGAAIRRRVPQIGIGWSGIHPLWAAALIPFALDAVTCLSPEWFYDAKVYHLGLPERLLMDRKFPVTPGNMLTFLPLNCEMLYAAALDLGGEECARILNFGFGALLALGAAALAAGLAGPKTGKWAGPLAAAVMAGMPLVMVENGSAFADNLRAFWEILALGMLIRGAGSLAAAGALLGLALGAKYLAGISCLFGGAVVSVRYLKGTTGRRQAAAFLALGVLAAAPWLGRNWLAGRDPVYPLGARIFNSLGFSDRLLARWEADNRHYGVKDMNLGRWLTLPYRLVMDREEGEFGTFTTGPLPLVLAPLLLAFRRPRAGAPAYPREDLRPADSRRGLRSSEDRRTGPGLALGFLGFQWLVWSLTSHLVRYLLPGLAVLSALLAWASAEAGKSSMRYARILIGIALLWTGFSLVQRCHYFSRLEDLHGVFSQVSGRESRVESLARRGYGERVSRLPKGRVLLVGEECVLGLGRPWKGASIYDKPPLEEWAAASGDERRFSIKVRQAGIQSVLVNGDSLNLRMARGDYRLSEREWNVLNAWWRRLGVLFSDPPRIGLVAGPSENRARAAGLPVRSKRP